MKVLISSSTKIKILCAENCSVKVKIAESQKPIRIKILSTSELRINALENEIEELKEQNDGVDESGIDYLAHYILSKN